MYLMDVRSALLGCFQTLAGLAGMAGLAQITCTATATNIDRLDGFDVFDGRPIGLVGLLPNFSGFGRDRNGGFGRDRNGGFGGIGVDYVKIVQGG